MEVHHMLKSARAGIVLGVLALSFSPPARGAGGTATYKVIVNSSNSVASLSAAEASQLLLKRATRWSHGPAALPVDLPVASSVRDAFSRDVLGKPAVAIEAFWTKQIFSGQAVPPVIKPSESEIVAYVRENPGAIGYVSDSTSLESGVKAIPITGRR
jgi:ABC-type phosphate transport system substrate-binding protein